MSDNNYNFANFILDDLKQSDEGLGLAYLQIKYGLGYSDAVRVLNYIISNNNVKEGNYGSVLLKAPDGKEYKCELNYRLLLPYD